MSMMWWHDGALGWGGWLVMSIFMLAFWTAIVLAGVALWKSLGSSEAARASRRDGSEARRLLDERFARGEIDAEEYIERRDLLSSGR